MELSWFSHITRCFWLKFHRCSVKAEHQDEGEAEAAEATETKERAGVLTQHMKVQPRNVKISPPNLQVLRTNLMARNGPWDWEGTDCKEPF